VSQRTTNQNTTLARPNVMTVTPPDVVAAAVLACPHVVGLRSAPMSGVGAEVATYLPGRRVNGVRLTESAVAVRVVGWFGPSVAELASEVRAAVKAVVPTAETIDVFIDDLIVPPDRTRPTTLARDDALALALAGRRSPAFTDPRTSPSASAAPLDGTER
jgi:hypothetical protein